MTDNEDFRLGPVPRKNSKRQPQSAPQQDVSAAYATNNRSSILNRVSAVKEHATMHSRENSKLESSMPLDASHAASNFYGISQHPSSRQNRQQDKENQKLLQQNLHQTQRFQTTQVQLNNPLNPAQSHNPQNTSEYVSLQHANLQSTNPLLINQTSKSTNITNYDSVHSRTQYHSPNYQLPATRQSSIYIPNQENTNNNNPSPSSKQVQLTYEIYRVQRDQLRLVRRLNSCVKYVVCLLVFLNLLVASVIIIYFLRYNKD